MLDLTTAPPGIAEYAEMVRNLTNQQLFERIQAWPDREPKTWNDAGLDETMLWTLRCEIEELARRLTEWLAFDPVPLPPFSPEPKCPKCGSTDKRGFKTAYHAETESESICDSRIERGREHMHRQCKACAHEWIEDCADRVEITTSGTAPDP